MSEYPGDIADRFKYHPPTSPAVIELHETLREHTTVLAGLYSTLPAGRERSTALTKLEEALMWGNAAIARNQEAVAK